MYLIDFSKNMDLIKDKNSFQGHLVAFYRFSKFLRVGSSARIFEKMFFSFSIFYVDQSKTTLMNFSNQIFFILSFIPMRQNLMIPMCPLSVHVRCRPPWIVKCLKIWICRFTSQIGSSSFGLNFGRHIGLIFSILNSRSTGFWSMVTEIKILT